VIVLVDIFDIRKDFKDFIIERCIMVYSNRVYILNFI